MLLPFSCGEYQYLMGLRLAEGTAAAISNNLSVNISNNGINIRNMSSSGNRKENLKL
jgi:hypothetical protein